MTFDEWFEENYADLIEHYNYEDALRKAYEAGQQSMINYKVTEVVGFKIE